MSSLSPNNYSVSLVVLFNFHSCLFLFTLSTLLSSYGGVAGTGVSFVSDNRIKPRERDGSHPKTPKEINSIITYPAQVPQNKVLEPVISSPDVDLVPPGQGDSGTKPISPTSIFYFWFLIISLGAVVSIAIILTGLNFLIRVGRLLLSKLGWAAERDQVKGPERTGIPRQPYYDPESVPEYSYPKKYPEFHHPGRSWDQQSFKSNGSGRRPSFRAQLPPPPPKEAPKEPVSINNSENLSYSECLEILGVVENREGVLSRGEINRSFRRKSLVIHPDKHLHLAPNLLEEKTKQFRLLCSARDKLLTLAQDD